MLIHQQDELSDYIKSKIDEILKRLLNWEPIQYITGEAQFHGMNLQVAPGVLIPRPETEELVDIIIDENKGREDLRILDLCTGSGCIAIALARNLPFSQVTAIDISDEALKIANANAKNLKVKIKFEKADIYYYNPSSKFDIIVSNPPYVMDHEAMIMSKNVLNFEPHEALFVRDEEPLVFYSRIIDIASQVLVEGGRLYLEINPLTAKELEKLVMDNKFNDVKIIRDSFGKNRFLRATFKV